jgi:mannose-6-phosphate isomerase-like protein (cupin superfamily)
MSPPLLRDTRRLYLDLELTHKVLMHVRANNLRAEPTCEEEAAKLLTQTLEESRKDHRGGQVSYLLLGRRGRVTSRRLSLTWVEGARRGEQPPHRHEDNEQAYVIVQGRGLMKIGNERQEVERGTLILIPPGEVHSIESLGDEPLVYVSATSPPFEIPPGRWEAV